MASRSIQPGAELKMAVLDDYANISHAHFSTLASEASTQHYKLDIDYFASTLNPHIPSEHADLVSRLATYDIISTMRERTAFPASILDQLPRLKLLLTTGPRNAAIDTSKCTELGIVVAGTPVKLTPARIKFNSTNEQTWALILGLVSDLVGGDGRAKAGKWQGKGRTGLKVGLAEKTIGVLGLGWLGTQCATTAIYGFGMNVLCWSESLTQEKADEKAESRGLPKGAFRVAESKEALLREADVVSLHYVLSERSRGMLGREELAMMKSSAFLVNTSRGPLVNEEALVEAVKGGKIAGVGLDVFATEPLPQDSPWVNTNWADSKTRVLLSPHMGYVEERGMHSWYDEVTANIQRWLKGEELMARLA